MSETPEWVLTPSDPSENMVREGARCLAGSGVAGRARRVYCAMIAARPAMPEGMREAVARIIDPWTFGVAPPETPLDQRIGSRERIALSKAAAIIRLIAGGEG